MQYQQYDDTFFVYVEQNESVMETLTQFCKDHEINNGYISGIGAVKNATIGAYDIPKKEYLKETFSDNHELVSCQGNVTLLNGAPFIHIHLVLGDHHMNTKGGHLFEMDVAAVGEFVIRKLDGKATRELDSNIGLATWCLAHKEK